MPQRAELTVETDQRHQATTILQYGAGPRLFRRREVSLLETRHQRQRHRLRPAVATLEYQHRDSVAASRLTVSVRLLRRLDMGGCGNSGGKAVRIEDHDYTAVAEYRRP